MSQEPYGMVSPHGWVPKNSCALRVRTRTSRADEPNRVYAETCALQLPTSMRDEKLVYRVFLRQYVQIAQIYLHLAKFY